MNNGDEPAYPCTIEGIEYPGMTKRERFAMAAMEGYFANCETWQEWTRDGMVAEAAEAADAMLAELEKRDEPASSENVS